MEEYLFLVNDIHAFHHYSVWSFKGMKNVDLVFRALQSKTPYGTLYQAFLSNVLLLLILDSGEILVFRQTEDASALEFFF